MLFDEAVQALQKGKLADAEKILRQIISKESRNFDALHMLAIVCSEQEKIEEAARFFGLALEIDSTYPPFYHNFGLYYTKIHKYENALAQFEKALALFPNYAPVHSDRGCALAELGRLEEALRSHNGAVLLAPNDPRALFNRALTFWKKDEHLSALRDYDEGLKRDPNHPNGWLGRGNVLASLKRYDEAFAAYDKALALKPDLANAWLGRGNVLYFLKRYDEAFAAYDKALALNPDLANAWLGRGNVLYSLKRYDEASAAYDKALAVKSDLADAWLGRGNVLCSVKRYDEASAAYDKALALKPDTANAWLGRANVLNSVKRYDQAYAAYDKALALDPELDSVEAARLHAKMHLCNWSNLEPERDHLTNAVRNEKGNTEPFAFLGLSGSPEDQHKCAVLWNSKRYPASNKPIWNGEVYKHNKIRIGYVSADFYEHATAYLMAGTFESHDKAKFDVTAISIGPDDNSDMRQRLRKSFDRFIDCRNVPDAEIANEIKKAEIDILIDLNGLTEGARTDIFACRPAPIQVDYLGYPGTTGSKYIDYVIGDQTVLPPSIDAFFSEKLVRLPYSYQANDAKRIISDRVPTRTECGLPEASFVFCCFNNNYKILPDTFDCWMRILKQREEGVLWLIEDNPTAASNLRNEAAKRGVKPDRLVFAKRMPLSEHLARHRVADLFLDTLPYNAHTTASDALWAGLPVLTQMGETFAGRVAASLLNAIGLPELITQTNEQYEALAVDLASQPETLSAIKARLAQNRLTTPLFKTELFTRNIESAYEAMYDRYQKGLSPDHIYVPR
jgi:predicted O-linked N-acetylglucosamine transferase (SPINDLY family)